MTSAREILERELAKPTDDVHPDDLWLDHDGSALAELERTRQLCAEDYPRSPLWKARVDKDPDYFKTFSPGRKPWR